MILAFSFVSLVWITTIATAVLVMRYRTGSSAVAQSGRRALGFGIACCATSFAAYLVFGLPFLIGGSLIIGFSGFIASLLFGVCHLMWFHWLVSDVRRSRRSQPQSTMAPRTTKT